MAAPKDGQTKGVSATTTPQPTLTLTLPPEPQSVRRARRALSRAQIDPDLDHTVSLLTSEVVTNAITHAADHGDIQVAAAFAPGYARIEVLDRGPGFDPDVRHGAAGFGLRLLDKLATRWGVERASGTLVWFEVDRRRRRFSR
jgi:anti-sigma regulatory factor (Ser/Thr protein kinase)